MNAWPARIGAACLATAGILWGLPWSADNGEAFFCTAFGVGFLVVAASLSLAGRTGRWVLALGLGLAAVGGTKWMLDGGNPLGVWMLMGAGTVAAFLVALAVAARPAWGRSARWALLAALAAMSAGAVRNVASSPGLDLPYGLANWLGVAGAVLLLASSWTPRGILRARGAEAA